MAQRNVPFVGRDDALQRLDSALADAAAGEGSVVLVYGEAGIGKTRLCGQVARAHRDRGGAVLVGRAAPEEAAITFGPIADALRAARRAEPALWEAASAHADVLSAIVPELTGAVSGSEHRYVDRPVQFETLLDAAEESARADQAVLWVIDDVHWADDVSWHFILYAARRVPAMSLVLVASYRAEEFGPASPRWPSLVQLKRDPHVLSLPLARLSDEAAGRLVRALDPDLDADLVTEIVRRSAGTPLLVEALTSMATSSGALPELPDVALATVRARAARLTPAARELLALAAAAGLTIEEQVLVGLGHEAAVGELVAVGLLKRETDCYRFTHPLLREAVWADVPLARRGQLHGMLAAAVAQAGDAQPERIAGHLERAGQPAAALATLEQAAAQARQAGDIGSAATQYLAAFRLARGHAELMPRSASLELAAIRDLFLTRRWTELDPLLRDAWSRRDGLSPGDREFLAVALGWHLFVLGQVAEAWAHIRRELSVPDQQAEHTARLHSQAASIAWYRSDPEAALQHAEVAFEVARQAGDTETVWWARHHRILAHYQLGGDRRTALNELRESAGSAHALGLVDPEVNALWAIAGYTMRQEDVGAAMAAATLSGHSAIADHLRVLSAAILTFQGRADEAEALLVRAGPRIRLGEPCFAAWVDVTEALLYLHRGALDDARRLLHGLATATEAGRLGRHATYRTGALGWIAWEEGRWADTAASLDSCAQRAQSRGQDTLASGLMFLPLHIDALLRLDQAARAETVMGRLPAGADEDRFYRASRAAARFRLAPDQPSAADARSAAASAPWPWLSALVMLWQGEFLGDAEAATGSAMLSEDIGAPLTARRAERVLSRMGIRLPSRPAAGPLSERELEVAQLVAQGLSNPAIAARLYLSRPTVASHVTHILTKLGFSSRAQIAAWVAGQGTGSQA